MAEASFDNDAMRGHCDFCGLAGECGNDGYVIGPAVQVGAVCVDKMTVALREGRKGNQAQVGEFGPVAKPKRSRVPAEGNLRVESEATE